jgi:hypothetical protein
MFLWRLAKQSLPTNDVRIHHRMADDDRFQLCGAADSWQHMLLDCTMYRCVWEDNDITEHLCRSDEGDASLWLANLMETLKSDDHAMVFVTLWSFCHAKRNANHDQHYQSPPSTFSFVQSFINDVKLTNDTGKKKPVAPAVRDELVLIPPPQGMINIKVDAAMSKSTARGAVAPVARSDGDVFAGASVVVFPGKPKRRRWMPAERIVSHLGGEQVLNQILIIFPI